MKVAAPAQATPVGPTTRSTIDQFALAMAASRPPASLAMPAIGQRQAAGAAKDAEPASDVAQPAGNTAAPNLDSATVTLLALFAAPVPLAVRQANVPADRIAAASNGAAPAALADGPAPGPTGPVPSSEPLVSAIRVSSYLAPAPTMAFEPDRAGPVPAIAPAIGMGMPSIGASAALPIATQAALPADVTAEPGLPQSVPIALEPVAHAGWDRAPAPTIIAPPADLVRTTSVPGVTYAQATMPGPLRPAINSPAAASQTLRSQLATSQPVMTRATAALASAHPAPAAEPAPAEAPGAPSSMGTVDPAAAMYQLAGRPQPAVMPVARAVADAVISLATSPNEVAEPSAPAPARTLTLQLSPGDLGTVHVRLHVTGQTLDIALNASDHRILGLLSRERDTLASVLRSADYDVNTLTIGAVPAGERDRPSTPSPSTPGGDSGRQDSSSGGGRGERQAWPEAPWPEALSPKAPRRDAPVVDRPNDPAALFV